MRKPVIVVLAQTPPPDHGQSRMVALMLDVLRRDGSVDVVHINARFSRTLEEIGEGSLLKIGLSIRYLLQAMIERLKHHDPVLYYVPGPVKLSAVARDWILLGILRLFYRRVVFHWHAIGQGEWAHGSARLALPVRSTLDHIARKLSAVVLASPTLSIVVSKNSHRDAAAVGSKDIQVVPNGIEDPCPDCEIRILPMRESRWNELRRNPRQPIRLLFLSHGTAAKGLFDTLEAVRLMADKPEWRDRAVTLTLAGGIGRQDQAHFDLQHKITENAWSGRLTIDLAGYVAGNQKSSCYEQHDLFIAASRWESFGLTVVEAMAHGMPVVAAASDGVMGILPAGYPYLVPVADPESLSTSLGRAVSDLANGDLPGIARMLRSLFLKEFTSDGFDQAITNCLLLESHEKRIQGDSGRMRVMAYLADQNPKQGRSLGISRMTNIVLRSLSSRDDILLGATVSRSSEQAPTGSSPVIKIPWSTRNHVMRVLTDNLHPLIILPGNRPDVWYFPKGFMPRMGAVLKPSVATIHDTIIQHYQDHYPQWRFDLEYNYWAGMLRSTIVNAAAIMTVSRHAKGQIEDFIRRYALPERDIHVTYEPCLYESIPQPVNPPKADYVLHLGSREPHKRTKWLVDHWIHWSRAGRQLPKLHVVGHMPDEIADMAAECERIVQLPFLEDRALVSQILSARAMILPSEVEGFGLPAIEAYYLGTPACFVQGTSVEEILEPATRKGGFLLDDPGSLLDALDDVLAMPQDEVRSYGLILRDTYDSKKIVDRMLDVFRMVSGADAVRFSPKTNEQTGKMGTDF